MTEGQVWDKLPKELVEDCAQLCKANSIEGRSPYGRSGSMAVQVGTGKKVAEEAKDR